MDKIQCSGEEDKYPEVSVKMFFDFMRTAYQVNESFEELATTLTANSEIDWSALAKVSLNLEEIDCHSRMDNSLNKNKDVQTLPQKVYKSTKNILKGL